MRGQCADCGPTWNGDRTQVLKCDGCNKKYCPRCIDAHDCEGFKKLSEGARRALMRPSNYADLPPRMQWQIDKDLGILDWDGT